MMQLIAVASGGALGAVLRWLLSSKIQGWIVRDFPIGTFSVNILGSLLLGITYVLLVERLNLAAEWRLALITGLLGAFTTFSTFSLEAVQLLSQGRGLAAGSYVVGSVLLCLLATASGLLLARQF